LTTLATLLLELSLTRIFSVVFYYHFAFLAISIALFGLGVGGVFSYIVAGWKTPLFRKLGYLSMLNSLLVMAALAVVVAQKEEPGVWGLTLVYFTTALPFFVSGTIVSLAISETVERIDRVYFFDLLGASGGCLLLVPFLNHFGGTPHLCADGGDLLHVGIERPGQLFRRCPPGSRLCRTRHCPG
jgi:uncharacterized membrane protein